MNAEKRKIVSFKDLEVYRRSYDACMYDIAGRQLYRLAESWSRFKGRGIPTT